MTESRDRLRALPSVDRLLACQRASSLARQFSRAAVVSAIRLELDACRQRILAAQDIASDAESLLQRVEHRLLAADTRQACARSSMPAVSFCTPISGARHCRRTPSRPCPPSPAITIRWNTISTPANAGSRFKHASDLLRDLTGAGDALVVNNNAASLVLLFERPGVLTKKSSSRAASWWRSAAASVSQISCMPAAPRWSRLARRIARASPIFVPPSPTRPPCCCASTLPISSRLGFVEQPTLRELADCAREHGILAVDDLGSGTLIDTTRFGLAYEPTIQDSVRSGFNLVCFSGDKLLGGPQAGVIIGKHDLIARLKRHPLARALRVDKLTYAALIATLKHYPSRRSAGAGARLAHDFPIARRHSANGGSLGAGLRRPGHPRRVGCRRRQLARRDPVHPGWSRSMPSRPII